MVWALVIRVTKTGGGRQSVIQLFQTVDPKPMLQTVDPLFDGAKPWILLNKPWILFHKP